MFGFQDMKAIRNQVIVIADAFSPIGLAIAKNATRRGARVVLASKNQENLDSEVKMIRDQGGDALAMVADLTRISDLEKIRDYALAKHGHIDTWIHHGNLSMRGKLINASIDEERQVFETNFWGVRNSAQVAISSLKESRGSFIYLSPPGNERGFRIQGICLAAQVAIDTFMDSLRLELKNDKTLVNVSSIKLSGPVRHPNIVADEILEFAERSERTVPIPHETPIQGHQYESVLPLLSQGMKQILQAGSYIAKTKVKPFMKEWREYRENSDSN